MRVRWRMSLSVLLMGVGVSAGIAAQSNEVANPRIVLVCEHGAAKSVIAAAYFNKLAERGLREPAMSNNCSINLRNHRERGQ
jgi:hypothetical protein